ncbi:MAG: DivIVA domain-containing protein [Acidimicrobiia bacterium]|nr:DivIVA domain-containing protein [Acidimicrobiia bacterium]
MNDFRDLGNHEFEVTRRGYDREQVDLALAELRAEVSRLESQLSDAVVPDDGTYPEPVQAELDRVAVEVESVISAAREAAEGLRTRAAAEASRWREEADEDARRWRAEAEAESARLRTEAASAAERTTAAAQDEAAKRQSDADSYSARVREEADAYAQLTKQVAESEAAQVKEEADAYSRLTRQAAVEESAEARESADAYAARVSSAADTYSVQTREAADNHAAEARAEAQSDASAWRSEAEAESSRLRDEAEAYATEVRSAAREEADRVTAEARAAADEARTSAEEYARALRQSADAETFRQRVDAQAAGELARATVWDEATAILENVAREMVDVRERAENESLAIIAEAEQQSHRLVSQARQSSEEQRRAARIEADRLVGDAQEQHDEIIEAANRAAAAAQERAQALERRREELMGQLEKAQKSMKAMEEELETRRETLRDREAPADSSTVKVVPQSEPDELAGVRVIPSAKAAPTGVPVSAEEIMDEVRSLRAQREQAEADIGTTPAPEPVAPAVAAKSGNEIDALFANLRQVDQGDPAQTAPGPPQAAPDVDPDQMRERLLLPLQNRAHRDVKRRLTEQQNLALEQLRVTGVDWNPDLDEHVAAFSSAIGELVVESARAGYLAARELGIRTEEPPEISPEDLDDLPTRDFAVDLAAAVAGSLEVSRNAGEPSRKVSAAVSRVYRSWRTDAAEHRLRELSDVAYADALRTALRHEGYEETEWALGDWASARHAS